MTKRKIQTKRTVHAFTLIELLMVVVIIGILISLLLPAVQAAREAARRSTCAAHLMQIGIAAKSFEEARGFLPPGSTNPTGPIRNVPIGDHMGWLPRLLPYLEMNPLYQEIDFSQSVYSESNQAIWLGIDKSSGYKQTRGPVAHLTCPSCPGWVASDNTSYVGCHSGTETPIDTDNNGVFFLNSKIQSCNIPDGTSNTIYFGEAILPNPENTYTNKNNTLGHLTIVPPDGLDEYHPCNMGWMTGTAATLRNTGSSLSRVTGPCAIDKRFYLMTADYVMSLQGRQQTLNSSANSKDSNKKPESTSSRAANDAVVKKLQPLVIPQEKWKTEHPAEYLVGGFNSFHAMGGANFSMGDGSLRFISPSIDQVVYQALGNRRDSQK